MQIAQRRAAKGSISNMIQVSASILNSDLSRLGDMVEKAGVNGSDMIHVDVMDGVFVENITYGSAVQKSFKDRTDKIIDTHLMVQLPERQIKLFADAGSDIITFHAESDCDIGKTIDLIHSFGVKAGVAIKPATPAETVLPYIKNADMILVMTVEPGYGGQGFIPETLGKIKAVRKAAELENPTLMIQVDGGINAETAALVKEAGADVLVAGTYLFRAEDMAQAVRSLR